MLHYLLIKNTVSSLHMCIFLAIADKISKHITALKHTLHKLQMLRKSTRRKLQMLSKSNIDETLFFYIKN